MNKCDKPIILTFIGNYLPGYKAGGILRQTVNTIDHLCNEFEFRIVTRDRDLGDDRSYTDIKINQWQHVGNAMVYYLSPESDSIKDLFKLIINTQHNVLYLNSFFDALTIKVLLIRFFHLENSKPIIIAPWGEFNWASLKQKFLKKILFIIFARLFGLYKNLTWRASSKFEKIEIIRLMRIKSSSIQITRDFPIKNVQVVVSELQKISSLGLRIVFLSRISREKNLDYALRVLKKVSASIVFDIFGPVENKIYWKECQMLIEQLPSNVKVNYLGSVKADEVVNVFSRYDLFLFPSAGEAYGHVIAECLMAGTPVLMSTETPWRNLQQDHLGWDIDLANMDSFVEIIEKFALQSNETRLLKRDLIKAKVMERLFDPVVLEENRQLFLKHVI